MKRYDVIIAGASFAGLAVASRISSKKVLLVDRKGIGTHQVSACGTTVKMVRDVGCESSVLKTFDVVALHTKSREVDIPLPEQFCTIDYGKFCRTLAKQNAARFLRADVSGMRGSAVVTSKGSFRADIVVDCTGWQAVLASSIKENYVSRRMLSFGIETEIPYRDSKLRFFVDPDIIENGVAWIFPCKATARFGVAKYCADTDIMGNLKKFLRRFNLKAGRVHGGFFCSHLKSPVVRDMFVVGCAAGQTLPLTGEGIRRSVYFGLKCGKIIQRVLNNEISLRQGQKEYKEQALKHRKYYDYLSRAQDRLPALSDWKLRQVARLLSIRPIAGWAWKRYEAI